MSMSLTPTGHSPITPPEPHQAKQPQMSEEFLVMTQAVDNLALSEFSEFEDFSFGSFGEEISIGESSAEELMHQANEKAENSIELEKESLKMHKASSTTLAIETKIKAHSAAHKEAERIEIDQAITKQVSDTSKTASLNTKLYSANFLDHACILDKRDGKFRLLSVMDLSVTKSQIEKEKNLQIFRQARDAGNVTVPIGDNLYIHPDRGIDAGEKIEVELPDGTIKELTVQHLDENQIERFHEATKDEAIKEHFEFHSKEPSEAHEEHKASGQETPFTHRKIIELSGETSHKTHEGAQDKSSRSLREERSADTSLLLEDKLLELEHVKLRDAIELIEEIIEKTLRVLLGVIKNHEISLASLKQEHRVTQVSREMLKAH